MPRMDENDESSASERKIETIHGLNPIDVLVGRRVRSHRIAAGLSEEKLGAVIGVPVAKLQAYERGEKRFGINRLYEVSIALGCLPMVFFEDG